MDNDDDMPDVAPTLWQQDFTAGAQSPACACPSPKRTRQATSWLLGWEKSIQRLLAQNRRGEQTRLAAVSALHVHTG
ncbi:hypothetical protein [Azohydromonas lata]|uniref:Uncharacterized protein n=1 Tax=Azohydromonas lata TaxID=45677 RepID=A0ABU5I9U3_9BURK|nr:hypothetical protein [Azohydromonas lata]MDZ5455619.1 hypothetical protein [Azohydromonas lata]